MSNSFSSGSSTKNRCAQYRQNKSGVETFKKKIESRLISLEKDILQFLDDLSLMGIKLSSKEYEVMKARLRNRLSK